MRTAPSTLLPLLRSQVQGQILALLLLNPDQEFSLGEVAGKIGSSVQAAHTEVNRLVTGGFVLDRRVGTSRMVRANTASPLNRTLTELMGLTYGPIPVLIRELSTVAGIDEAYIYGSWAARYDGEPGQPPHDVDVLVVGSPDLDDLEEAIRRAEVILLREVNVQRIRPRTWQEQTDPFIQTVRSRPLVRLELEQNHPREEADA